MSPADSNAASVRSSISRKKLAANRRNAERSTGPRTDAGKRVSSRNAVSHAIFCRDLLVGDERRDELVALRESVRAALAPRDAVEHELVDSIVAARWQLRRCRAAQRAAHDGRVRRVTRARRRRLRAFDWKVVQRCSLYSSAEARKTEMDRHAPQRAELQAEVDRLPGSAAEVMAGDFRAPRSAWERLSRYEQRLEQNLARAMRELRTYRKDLAEFGRPEPGDVDDDPAVDADEPKAQNEPTARGPAASNGAAKGCEMSSSSMGVPPMSSNKEECMGETPMLREEEKTSVESPPTSAD